jgi:prolyl oligopeptidase
MLVNQRNFVKAVFLGLGLLPVQKGSLAMAAQKQKNDESYLWLEEVEGKKALDWVRQQNDRSLKELERQPNFAAFKDASLRILQAKDKLASGQIQGDYVYNFWQDAGHIRGIWRRSQWDTYQQGKPEWELVLDVDELAKKDDKNYVFHGATCLRPRYERCLIRLSVGGSDTSYYREFDLSTKKFVEDGFALPPSKSALVWVNQDQVFLEDALTLEQQTTSGYPRIVRRWQRGTKLEAATQVFHGEASDVAVHASVVHDGDKDYVFFVRALSFFTEQIHYERNGQLVELPLPRDIHFEGVFHGKFLFTNRLPVANIVAGSLIAADLEALAAGKAEFTSLFTPTAQQALKDVARGENYLYLSLLDQVRSKVLRLEEKGDKGSETWERMELPLSEQGALRLTSVDEDSNRLLVTYEDFLVPPSLYAMDGRSLSKNLVQQVPPRFNAEGLIIKQEFATSKDGVKIPYFIVHRENLKLDGKNPTLLYGYGGFEVAMQPSYMAAMGKLWLERGGVFVLANIRGGGEFGPSWHQAALQEHRQTAFDDFASVAEDLLRRKITSPRHLGIQGGSNGGLLMGATFTQRPELFRAVVCQVPLLDMLRYHKLLAGASWMAEYGDPDDPVMHKVLRKYSPFHNLHSDKQYPEVFFVTSTRDDRVHPAHARKMAARMQDLAKPFLYYENIEGGHSAGANQLQHAQRYALEFSYLWARLGA